MCATVTPLCVGEHHFTRWDYVSVLENRLADYIMPDVAWCAGISEFRHIASLAEPDCIRANTNATAIMIGERVADFIKGGK